jgi:hypothetical protein
VHLLARSDDLIRAEVDELLRSAGLSCQVDVDGGRVLIEGPVDPHQRREAVPVFVADVDAEAQFRAATAPADRTAQQVTAHDDHKDPGGWRPGIFFRVNGPISSGSQLYAEFSLPTKPKWVEFDCDTGEIKKGEWWKVECRADADKAVPYVGTVGFTIRMRNELHGTNATLFTGKAKVVRIPRYAGSKGFYYYVMDDWTIPIGYVYFQDFDGRGSTDLKVGFWYRGAPPTNSCHLFYQGKEIARRTQGTMPELGPVRTCVGHEQCQFGVYRPEDAERGTSRTSPRKNPGEYEVKILIVNKLARSIKFSVDANGVVDNGIATANKLGSDRIIVPVQVIGDQGPWDKLAWKTGAFYGNPLTGFAALP